MNTAIAAILLATAPASPTDRAAFEVADVEVSARDGAVTMLAFDEDGEVSAEVSTWLDEGVRQVDVTFPDGAYLFATIDGEVADLESSDVSLVAERLAVIETVLPEVTDAEVAECGLGLLGLAASVGTGPWGVMVGVAGFSVTCVRTIVEELQGEGEVDEDADE